MLFKLCNLCKNFNRSLPKKKKKKAGVTFHVWVKVYGINVVMKQMFHRFALSAFENVTLEARLK